MNTFDIFRKYISVLNNIDFKLNNITKSQHNGLVTLKCLDEVIAYKVEEDSIFIKAYNNNLSTMDYEFKKDKNNLVQYGMFLGELIQLSNTILTKSLISLLLNNSVVR